MPIYEFYSPDTHKVYSFLSRRVLPPDALPRCPDGATHRMERLVSGFAFIGRSRKSGGKGTEDGEDLSPSQEAEMMRLAGEMEAMGDADPDPKTLGNFLRRMVDATGRKPPGEMEEFLARLEKGEDPERLEEDFSEALESWDPDGEEEQGRVVEALRKHFRGAPRRDPVLYEMADFLPKDSTLRHPKKSGGTKRKKPLTQHR